MKSKKFLWIAAAILLAGMISSCEELGVDGIEDLFPPTPGPTPTPVTSVTFNSVTPDGGVDGNTTYNTTFLTLDFSARIDELSKDDITLTTKDEDNTIEKITLEGEGPSYTLYVSIEETGNVEVSVNKAGVTGGPKEVTVYGGGRDPTLVVFSSLEANAGKTGTTYLTLTFGTAVADLEGKNITLNPGGTGAKANSLSPSSGSNTSYKLDVSGITKSGDVSVTVNKLGYVFNPPTKTATVLGSDVLPPQPPGGGDQGGGQDGGGDGGQGGDNPGGGTIGTGTEVTFTGVQADGGEGYTTTALSLHFDKAIAGLNVGDITLEPVGDANKITTGTLVGSGPSYTLYVSDVRVEGFVKVKVEKSGYAVSGNPRTVAVHTAGSDQKPATTVYFTSLSADGVSGEKATAELTLTFDTEVKDLSMNDIYLNAGGTGAGVVSLSDSNKSYKLGVTNITTGGLVSVTVTKEGYAFKPTTRGATVYSGSGGGDNSLTAVTLNSVVVSKTSNGNTTELKLTFSDTITGLTDNHITITNPANGWAVKNGKLAGDGNVYTLPVFVPQSGDVTVVVSDPEGYVISGSPQSVRVTYSSIVPTSGASDNPSIKAKFGIYAEGTDGVTAAFKALSAYIKTPEFSSYNNVIKLGDWIDLDGGLTVDPYINYGTINMGNTSMYPDFKFDERMMLRLIVVGINSFKNKNENDTTPHVVFHFQNAPVYHPMNIKTSGNPTNAGGYPASTLRKYLTPVGNDTNSGKFLAGLKNAGVPEEVLWAPKRVVATSQTDGEMIQDKLWVPTLYEMTGKNQARELNNVTVKLETSSNQAKLEYYTSSTLLDKNRKKYAIYIGEVIERNYWLASPYPNDDYKFCIVNSYSYKGLPTNIEAHYVSGVVPAFCVQ